MPVYIDCLTIKCFGVGEQCKSVPYNGEQVSYNKKVSMQCQ